MKIRITKPKDNKYYQTKSKGGYSKCIKGKPTDANCDVLSNCVGYACGRFNEIIGSMKYPGFTCNAENFCKKAKTYKLTISNKPTLGGIMVWEGLGSRAGHVAIVERIDNSNQIYTSESAYNGKSFYNATRTNNNGRWGMNTNYKFIGCVVNPSIKEIKYTKGNYICNYNMYVRTGAGTKYAVKLVKQLTKDGQKNATSSNLNNYAIYKKGTIFTALEIISNSNGIWAKTPSGYVCIYNSKEYCSKK